MATPFLSEIRLVSFGFPPRGWAFCNGQLLAINQNQALFSLLGTTYGGNGTTTFALPDLRDRVPIHVGNGYVIGQTGGEQAHTLIVAELPTHTHGVAASTLTNGGSATPNGNVLGGGHNVYRASGALTTMSPTSVGNAGGNQAHQNMQPLLALNFCIALQGIFPSRN